MLVTVDCVVFGLDDHLKVLLIERENEPYSGAWALPGGFVRPEEDLEAAARRELEEETGVRDVFLEQLFTFGSPERDPRDRVVSVAYYALAKLRELRANTDARDARWFEARSLPGLAFDHDHIVKVAQERLRGKVRYQPIGFELLPTKFTLSQLQKLYETVLERSLDKRNFRKKILSMGLLDPLDEHQKAVAHRAARLYRFNRDKYQELLGQGFNFEL
ncbi:MAG: NUDIX domain-containing protein [Myxococcota bacterium]